MTVPVSRRVQRVKPSATLAVTARAARLKAQGKDVIGLGAGEPDFDTPVAIADAGVDAIRKGFTRYTHVEGIDELKDAIAAKFERDNGISYERAQILVSSGAKQTIYNICMAVLDPGDEAIIPAPYWVSYPDMVLLADGLPVMPLAGMAQGYKITPRQLAAAITPKTRLFLINSPCNPTGAAYTRAELRALGEVLLEHPRIVIGTDDMYEKIYWGAEPFTSLLTAVPELYPRTVTINGVSKAYAMTGWRIGYCGGPKELISAMSTIQGQSTSNPSSIAQKAAVAALTGDQRCVVEMNAAFKGRRDFVVRALNALPGISCLPGDGTFYAFAEVSRAMAGLNCRDDTEFAELLLNEAGVAVVPGSGFGAPNHMRLSFACSMQTLEKALQRIARILLERVAA
ncbi:MAG: pyridoxal phosphate-dependent aminotransferase [Gammaproteobacteria bacterium]|nr:pyridoxal phosphate-dependent aminotransferase [Gammaproteobacteria bacterium]MBV9696529.1 pyridoxal phosphate-dependent aminotransferase [Gammaproteobacteria bacterium]